MDFVYMQQFDKMQGMSKERTRHKGANRPLQESDANKTQPLPLGIIQVGREEANDKKRTIGKKKPSKF